MFIFMDNLSTLEKLYREKIIQNVQKKLGIKNINAVPKIEKVVVNTGIGKLLKGSKDYSYFEEVISKITGQKPIVCKAKKSISNFSLKEGMPIGLKVTLRGKIMWDFLTKLIMFGFPRVRDFKGLSPKAFDKNGNYSIGISEYTIFPEYIPEDLSKVFGFQVTIVIKSNERNIEKRINMSKALLEEIGIPFKKS